MKAAYIITGLSLFLFACSGIRVVKVTKEGGEIALLGIRTDAMAKAREEMASSCGGPSSYEIVEQGEVVVGEETVGSSDTHGGAKTQGNKTSFGSSTSSRSTTTQKTEWRVKYTCKGAAAPPAAPAAGAAPAAVVRTISIAL